MRSPVPAIGMFGLLLASAPAWATGNGSCPQGTLDLGTATDYNLFVLGDFEGLSSDVQGRAAIGGDADLMNYSIGTLATGGGASLSVGDNLTATNGQVYNGAAEVGGSCVLTSFSVLSGGLRCQDAGAFDAGDHATEMTTLSATFSALPLNGTTTVTSWGGLFLTGTDASLNVFSVDLDGLPSSVTNLNTFQISVPAGALAVINVTGGTAPLFKNAGITVSGATNHDIVWNLETQTSLTVSGISVRGSILAPQAHVDFSNGNIEGTLVAASAEGSGEYHSYAFGGPVCQPPTTSECPVELGSELGPATGYNVYTVADLMVQHSDIEGTTAVGGNASGSGYGFDTGGGGGIVLEVKGDLTASNSQLAGGDGEVGGACTLTSFGTPDGQIFCGVSDVFDAGSTSNTDALQVILDWIQDEADDRGVPATLNPWWPQLRIDAGTASGLQIVTVDTCAIESQITSQWPWASSIQGWDIQAGSGATLVVNLTGTCGDFFFKNGFMGLTGGIDETDVVWVLQDMASIGIQHVTLRGSLLAPDTDVTFNNGNIYGQMIAESITGGGEFHEYTFDGDLCP